MGSMDNNILCIPSELLFEKGKWNGLQTEDLSYYYERLLSASEFRRRADLEHDPRYKQIIPQVMLRYQHTYFLHRQIKVNESRLNQLCPLFLGGHVEEFDKQQKSDLIEAALMRELNEEVTIKGRVTNKLFVGLLYIEDENQVNLVHVGLAYIFDITKPHVTLNEPGLENIGFVDIEYLKHHKDRLTYWSRLMLDRLEHIDK